jgi:hypothetical protein
VRLDQLKQTRLRNYPIHLGQKPLASGNLPFALQAIEAKRPLTSRHRTSLSGDPAFPL